MDNKNLNVFLQKLIRPLADYLINILPSINNEWWKECVLSNLSYRQQEIAKSSVEGSLNNFDLASLLRILDGNWYHLSKVDNIKPESRHYVKELQTIRNRWAHLDSREINDEDVYRDLDTMLRFAEFLSAERELIEEIREAKNQVLISNSMKDQDNDQVSEFRIGDIVQLKSNPHKKGAIIDIKLVDPETIYMIFIDGKSERYYSSQLLKEVKIDEKFELITLNEFHSFLTALQIKHPGISTLYSLNAARIDFIPYQFRPVLRFIRSDRPRMLIADSVGVGKTIEAGLILRELQSRRDVKSILIICPRPLVTESKWKREMRRFDENFTHIDGKSLNYCIDEMNLEGEWPDNYNKAIIPYTLFDETLLYGTEKGRKRRKGLLQLDPPPRFDMVIVDEAHHIRNQSTFRHKAVRFFCDHAEAVIFLTATPIQLGNHDLFVLLNVLRPDLVIDKESFEHMSEPNPHINEAVSCIRTMNEDWRENTKQALLKAEETSWGWSIFKRNPKFQQIKATFDKNIIDQDKRIQLIKDVEELHTFSSIINRTRRRDIGNFTIRKPETVSIEFTPNQRELHDKLLQIQAEIFTLLHGDINVRFMMSTIRRQAASCIFGLEPFLEEILSRHIDELAWEEFDQEYEMSTAKLDNLLETKIREILKFAKAVDKYDPKLESLQGILKTKINMKNSKTMLFSSFRHTLYYLYDNLTKCGFRVGLIHGGIPDEERLILRERFELSSEVSDCIDIMLFSEVGCEGLDYQFCDCMINYDLPWNPMRIEQRIGRIDRNGQKSEKVMIYNLITNGTVDADIYERCLMRIGVFENAIGGSEEILGEITKEIKDIAENYDLTEEERKEKLQQLSDNKIRLIQEQEKLEERQLELFGIQLPQEQIKRDIKEATSYWLTPKALKQLVLNYLQSVIGKDTEYILGDKMLKTLRLSQEARNILLKDYQKLKRKRNPMYRQWESWLKGNNQHLNITFESECASGYPEAAFLIPVHPLIVQAANNINMTNKVFISLRVQSEIIEPGKYEFAIYKWQYHGITERLELKPIAANNEITDSLLDLIQVAKANEEQEEIIPEEAIWDRLDKKHYDYWKISREEHVRKTKENAEFKKESLTTSHNARIALLTEQWEEASDDKIKRMRSSQIDTANADYARRLQEIEIAIERADIAASPVAYGIMGVFSNE